MTKFPFFTLEPSANTERYVALDIDAKRPR
jgi:hypothetical protein